MRYKAEVLTWHIGTGADGDIYRAAIAETFRCKPCCDTTAQPAVNLPTDPNLYIVSIECDDKVLAEIIAHPDYGDEAVLWSEEIVEDAI